MGDQLKQFTVHGPFTIPLQPEKGGKMVQKNLKTFWHTVGDLRTRRGIYLFGVRAGRGITPIYVGRASDQCFEQEAFTAHKRADHYNPALLDYEKGKPVMFFVAHPRGQGKFNATVIDEIETFLIDVASTKNPRLSNVRKKPKPHWRIRGVVRGKPGEASRSSGSFKKAIGIV